MSDPEFSDADIDEWFDECGDWATAANARCNFCDGPMPCYCPPPADVEERIEADMRARAKYSDLLDER